MNQVTKPAGTQAAVLAGLGASLASVRSSMPDSGSQFFRLLTDGNWVFGKEDNAVASGTEAAINIPFMEHGYSCWTNWPAALKKKNTLLGEAMFPINQAKPMTHTLALPEGHVDGDGAEWRDQVKVEVKFLDGKHADQQVTYKTSSAGGLNAIRGLMDQVMAKLNSGSTFVVPVVTIESDHYNHASYGRTYVPKFDVVAWMDLDGNEEGEGDGPLAVDAKVDAGAARKPAPAPEPEPVATANPAAEPTRRRRQL